MAANDRQREQLTVLLEQRGSVDRFTDIRRLSAGASGHFSVVMSATDTATGRRVALKFLLPMFTAGYRDGSFERESALLPEFDGQRDVIQMVAPRADFTETFTSEMGLELQVPFAYYALELAAVDLGTVIANGAWDSLQLLDAFRGVCRGVQRLHVKSIAHRDLKPPNCLVMADGSIRLSDLGTARRVHDGAPLSTDYQGPPGDRRYSAPELLGVLHDEIPVIALRSDFFGLGAMLFEMFAGTILGSHLYDAQFLADLAQIFATVKKGQRQKVFDELIPTIADARRIPSVATFGASVPRAIVNPLDSLIRDLSALDYRKRLVNFDSVFNRINICTIILKNEEKYQRWLAERNRRRERAALAASASARS